MLPYLCLAVRNAVRPEVVAGGSCACSLAKCLMIAQGVSRLPLLQTESTVTLNTPKPWARCELGAWVVEGALSTETTPAPLVEAAEAEAAEAEATSKPAQRRLQRVPTQPMACRGSGARDSCWRSADRGGDR